MGVGAALSSRSWRLLPALMVSSSNAISMLGTSPSKPRFDNDALRTLRVHADFHGPPRQITGAHFIRTRPHALKAPAVVATSDAALRLVGLDGCSEEELAAFLSGNELLPGSDPAAHCYCGHQFGSFAGQLGDGAAMYLGEVINDQTGERWELQLKGAGPTPFSRFSDGRKVLRSSIREFLASEAMHHLGIPTTRAGSCVTSGTTVERDVLYTGNAQAERCTVVSRIARTFVRFGSFEICRPADAQTGRAGPSAEREAGGAAAGPPRECLPLVKDLVDYVVTSWVPAAASAGPSGSSERARALLEHAIQASAQLAARWQGVGFTHGVLNTDNMSILGDTIDYGPYGFMEHFSWSFTPNRSDNGGRYSYREQPGAVEWNVAKLAETLHLAGALDEADVASSRERFRRAYDAAWLATFRAKLGITPVAAATADDARPDALAAEDTALIQDLLATMEHTGADFTATFLALGLVPAEPDAECGRALDMLCKASVSLANARKVARPSLPEPAIRQLAVLRETDPQRLAMFGVPPEMVDQQLALLDRQEQLEALGSEATKGKRDRGLWSRWLSRYTVRLAAQAAERAGGAERALEMQRANPTFVLREHLLQAAIARAEAGDFGGVRELLARCASPYADAELTPERLHAVLAELPAKEAFDIVLT